MNQWGGLAPDGTVPSGGRGTCWIVITSDGKYAFITNSLSDGIPGIGTGIAGISRLALSSERQDQLLGTTK